MLLVAPMVLPSAALAGEQTFFQPVAPGVYMHQGALEIYAPQNHGDISNLGLVVGQKCAALVDSGGSPMVGEQALKALRAITPLPLCAVIFTHMHLDHVFGSTALSGEHPLWFAHQHMPNALSQRLDSYRKHVSEDLADPSQGKPGAIIPDHLVADRFEIDLGGRKLTLKAWPTAHTDNDLSVMDEESGTLFTGDLCFREHMPVLDGSLKGWLEVIDGLAALPARHVVPGHGPVAATVGEALAAEREYLQNLTASVKNEIAQGHRLRQAVDDLATANHGDWKLFDEFQSRNVTTAYTQMEWD
jgi:quinoprotein relay system zinc metallohydrolase 2